MSDIEYFYSTHSAFAYLGSSRFTKIATTANRKIKHRPVDLPKVVAAARGEDFKGYSEEYRKYFFGREIQRWAQYRDAPAIQYRPTHHDNDLSLSSGMIIAASEAGINPDGLAHAILQAHWKDDADHADPETLRTIATQEGYDAQTLLNRAHDDDIQAIFKKNTEEAISRSVFGSPTYVIDGDMFYGQDRLELMEHALQTPFE